MRARALFLAVFLSQGCGSAAGTSDAHPTTGVDDAGELAAIARTLDAWHAAAAAADETTYFALLDESAVFLGTDATERWTKAEFLAYAHPHFAKGKAWSFKAARRSVVIDAPGTLAHFDEDLVTAGLGPARGSGVLIKRASGWKIVQYNLALVVPNDRFDAVKEAAGTAELLSSTGDEALSGLAFLAGSWVGADDGGSTEEHWSSAASGTMLGTGRTTKAGVTTFFEFLRIERREGKLVYVAQPRGGSPTEFLEVERRTNGITFENPAHDYPKRISYDRDGDLLKIRVEGAPGSPTIALTLHRALVSRTKE
ncbi:MAG: DUF6265 family protein [Polyangiaceae bacterium]